MQFVSTIVPGLPVPIARLSSVIDAKAIRFADGIGVKLEMANEDFLLVQDRVADQLVAAGLLPARFQAAWRPV